MIEITGYFCSGSNPNYYYFKVALEKSSSDQPMLANVRSSCSPVPNKLCKIYGNCCSIEKDTKEFIYYSQQNKGYYKRDQPCGSKVSSLENSSHSLQVFEVQRIYYLEVPRPFTNSSDMYCGFVQHISGCIKLQHSRVAFLRISSIDNSNKKIFLLMEETLFLIPYLSVGRRVDVLINELDIGQLCEDDYEENNVCDGTSTSPRINILRDMNIFLLDSIRFIHLHVKEKIAKSTCDTSSNCCCEFVDSCNIIENSLVKPRKCGCKEVFNIIKAVNFNAMCHQIRHNSVDFVESEMVVQGSILSIDLGGTMEIMVSARCRSENDIRSSPNSISVDSENFDDFTDDTVYTIIFSAPCPSLPILRKGTEVTLYSLLPVYLHDHLHGFAYTLRSSFSVISFPSSGSQYVIERNSKYTTAKLFGIDSNCNSKKWNKKRKHKTIDEEYELNSTSYSNSCGMFNIWRTKILRRIRRLLQVQNDETIAIVIQKLLCGAFLKGAENIDEKERILKKICSIIKLSNRSLLNEFNSIWYAQFSTIRSGEDSDYIASFLPQNTYMTTQLIPSEDILCSTKSSILLGFLTNLNINYLPSCTNATGNLVDTNYSEEDAFHIVIKNLDQHTIHLLSYCVRYSRQRSLIGLTSSMEECNSKTCPLILIRKYTILLSTPPVLAAKGGKRIPWLICDAKYIDIVIDQSLLSCTTYLDTTFSSSMKAYNPFGPTGLLKQVFTGNSFLIPDGFVGVVVSIELLLEHYKNNSDAKAFSTKAKGEDKYSLVLRDYFYPDTISVYAEFSAIKDLTVGMIVKVPSCLLCMPASKKNLYVKLHTPNVIEILGFASDKTGELQTLCKKVNKNPRWIDSDSYISSPECCYLSEVLSTNEACLDGGLNKSKSRCLWKFFGTVVFIKKISITIRCMSCQQRLHRRDDTFHIGFNNYPTYYCSKCSNHAFYYLWEGISAFDDGTGECNIVIEGEDLLQRLFNTRSHSFDTLKKLLADYVFTYGSFIYECNSEVTLDIAASSTSSSSNMLPSRYADGVIKVAIPQDYNNLRSQLVSLINERSNTDLFEIWAKLDHSTFLQKEKKTLVFNTKVQQANDFSYRYSSQFVRIPIILKEKTNLQVLHIAKVRSEKLMDEAYSLLEKLR